MSSTQPSFVQPFQTVYIIKYTREGYAEPCYKIGITNDFEKRLSQHEDRRYGLKGWIETLSTTQMIVPREHAGKFEQIWANEHINAFGFRRVRGGKYDSPTMNGAYGEKKYEAMTRGGQVWVEGAFQQSATENQLCYYCHSSDHQSRHCKRKHNKAVYINRFIQSGVPGYDKPILELRSGDIKTFPMCKPILKTTRSRGKERILKMLTWTIIETPPTRRLPTRLVHAC